MHNSMPMFDNPNETGQFFIRYNLPRLTQEEIDNLNKPVPIKEIEPVVNNLPKQKILGPVCFSYEFC